MEKYLLKTLLATLLLAVAMPLQAQMVSNNNDDEVYKVDQGAARAYRQGEVIVKFKEATPIKMRNKANGKFQSSGISRVDKVFNALGVTEADQLMPRTGKIVNRSVMRSYNGTEVKDRDMSGLYRLRFDQSKSVHDAIEQIKAIDDVEYAEPNYLVFIMSTDADTYTAEPLYSQQWGPAAINLDQLWAVPKLEGAKRPVIAILDTGIDITHPDLAANIWTNPAEGEGAEGEDDDNNGFNDDVHGWDFINQTSKIADYNGHGTHCAGIAAAVGDNGIGITGANPDAYIMPITVMQSDGTGDIATVIQGIDYATDNGADVLSMSFGHYGSSIAEEQALIKAYIKFIVLVASAGNDSEPILNPHGPKFPAAYSFVLGIEASDLNNKKASFSNYDNDGPIYSPFPDLYNYELRAPGVNIFSTYPQGRYMLMSGTSMACPLVAGAVSRLIQCKSYEYQVINREIFFGDLIHGINQQTGIMDIMAAYNITDADRVPTLWLVATELNDEAEGDGDFRPDAGEIIDLYPTLRNDWGNATNIKLHLEMGDELEDSTLIEIIENDVDFGKNLSGYGKAKSDNPIRFKIADNCADNRHIKLKFTATCDNVTEPIEQNFVIVVENGIELGGVINEDLTLYPNKHYIVTKSIAIPQGKTLTIKPGARLEFFWGIIQSEGKLIANGKPDSLIVFTTNSGNIYQEWAGIRSHTKTIMGDYYNSFASFSSSVRNLCEDGIYTNVDTTVFTLIKTDATPYLINTINETKFYPEDYWPEKTEFFLDDYLTEFHKELRVCENAILMNDKIDYATNPDYITPIITEMLDDYRQNINHLSSEWDDNNNSSSSFNCHFSSNIFKIDDDPCDTLSYCLVENLRNSDEYSMPFFNNCILNGPHYGISNGANKCNVYGTPQYSIYLRLPYLNQLLSGYGYSYPYESFYFNNVVYFNGNNDNNIPGKHGYLVGKDIGIETDHSDYPSWLGTSKEEIIRPFIYDSMNPFVDCFTTVDLSNMPTRPYSEAHGIVWKIVVNGYDSQDEFDLLPPLGVGRHIFEVYFNRDDMDTTVTPILTMGVRPPYTQIGIAEDGFWSVKDSVSVYTAYLTITGKLQADGVNRIYVAGAQDGEHFEIPIENTRFNVLVQAAGSMATGFAAQAGLGKVDLTWNNENNDFEDAMGFNVYRFQLNENNDTINRVRLNETILDIEATEFTDYEVTPGETYYYYYKVLSTDLKEYDISNVVAATPLTSTLGDANASGWVDVADVITTVNYAAGMEPRPFLFEAADVNADQDIDILDVIGIIKIITRPNTPATASIESCAIYSVEDGVVWVDSPIDLAGVQLTLNADQDAAITATETLNGFEQVGAWMDENSYLFLAYNMNGKVIPAGKHPILTIGDAEIIDIRLSDRDGHNVLATPAEEVVTGIGVLKPDVLQSRMQGIYDMTGRKVASSASVLNRLAPGIYIVNGKKTVVSNK